MRNPLGFCGSTPLTAGSVPLVLPCFLARHEGAFYFLPFSPMANTSTTAQRPADKQDATAPAQPVATVRYGDVSAAVFADTVEVGNGKTATRHRVSVRRSYRDQESGDWKHTNVLFESDLLHAAEALRRCFEIIEDRRQR